MPTTMILAPQAVQQFTELSDDGYLVPLVGGQLFLYEAGTTTKSVAYTDSSGNTPLPNPIVLNVRGEVAASALGASCGLWLDPTLAYKFVLAPATDTDPPTNAIWTVDNIVSPESAILAALQSYQASIAGVPIGAMMPWTGDTAPLGWLLCYGQALSRTTYSALFAVEGIAFGPGDGSSTFNLPDLRGRLPVGKDDMGGSPANRVTDAVSGVDAVTLGATGGDQNAQEDTLSASTTLNIALTDNGHGHVVPGAYNGAGAVGGPQNSGGGWATNSNTSNTAYTGITISSSASTTVTSSLTGASQNMPPVQVTNWIIFTGVYPP